MLGEKDEVTARQHYIRREREMPTTDFCLDGKGVEWGTNLWSLRRE